MPSILTLPDSQEQIQTQLMRIYSALSNKDALRIFVLAASGIDASKSSLEKYQFSKKRYYVRLKELVDLGLISKNDGVYKQTPLGTVVYENEVKNLEKIILKKSSLEILNELTQRNSTDENMAMAISDLSEEVLKDLESSIGLSNLKPIRLFRSWNELGDYVVEIVEKTQSEIYAATRYADFRTFDTIFRAAEKGYRANIIYGKNAVHSTNPGLVDKLITPQETRRIFDQVISLPSASMRQAPLPYSFFVVDKLYVAIEMANPRGADTFFAGVGFESPSVASNLISQFNVIFANAQSNFTRSKIEGREENPENPNSMINH